MKICLLSIKYHLLCRQILIMIESLAFTT